MANHALIQPTYLSKYTKVILRITKPQNGSVQITSLNNPCSHNMHNQHFAITKISTGVFSLTVPLAEKIFSITSDNHNTCFAISPYSREYRFIKTQLVQDNDVIVLTSYKANSSKQTILELADDIDITITLYYKAIAPNSINGYNTSGFLALHIEDNEICDVTESNILGAYSNIPNLKVLAKPKLSDTAYNHKDNSTSMTIYPTSITRRGATVKGMNVYPASSNIYFSRRNNEITARISHIYPHVVTKDDGQPGHRFYYCKSFIHNGYVFVELRQRPSRLKLDWRMKRFSRF